MGVHDLNGVEVQIVDKSAEILQHMDLAAIVGAIHSGIGDIRHNQIDFPRRKFIPQMTDQGIKDYLLGGVLVLPDDLMAGVLVGGEHYVLVSIVTQQITVLGKETDGIVGETKVPYGISV